MAPVRAKKDRRRWCRGKVGVDHVPVIEADKYFARRSPPVVCKWRLSFIRRDGLAWMCVHQRVCRNCGKVLEHTIQWKDCPDLRPEPVGPMRCSHCDHLRGEHHLRRRLRSCTLCNCRAFWWEEAVARRI